MGLRFGLPCIAVLLSGLGLSESILSQTLLQSSRCSTQTLTNGTLILQSLPLMLRTIREL